MSGTLVLVLRVLLAAALYLFLGLTLWLIWQDLRRAGYQAVRPRVPALRLEVRTRETEPFYRVFTQAEITVGRDPVCELQLDDEAVSARHAKFSFHHGQWWIEDLHSTNGTSLNTVKLTTATVLTDGDELRCGKVMLLVKLNTESMMSQPTKVEEQND